MMQDKVKQFETTLRKLLKKKRLTSNDMGMIEVMVYVAVESNLIDMPDVTMQSLNHGREYYFTKATPKQKTEAERYYALMGELGDTLGVHLYKYKHLKSFVQERMDGIVYSLCQNEHIEGALLQEGIMTPLQVEEFAHAHLNSLSDEEAVASYKMNVDNIIENARAVLYFLPIYREIIKAVAEVYELPELLYLLDDTLASEPFANMGSKAKAQIRNYMYKPSNRKLKRLDYIFANFCKLENFGDISDSIKENIKDYIMLCSTERIPKLEPVLHKGIAVFKDEDTENDEQEQQAKN